jgi:hypothetical protein
VPYLRDHSGTMSTISGKSAKSKPLLSDVYVHDIAATGRVQKLARVPAPTFFVEVSDRPVDRCNNLPVR